MKPTVQYRGEALEFGHKKARITPIDHPNPDGLVTNGEPAITSTIISWDRDSGRIETRNTIYIKEIL